jgi:hypothetical protein
MMRNPVRTLLYELFVKPVLQLVQRATGQRPDAASPESGVRQAGSGKFMPGAPVESRMNTAFHPKLPLMTSSA